MKIVYDKVTDTLTITLRDARIRESDEVRPGVIVDLGYDGEIVRFLNPVRVESCHAAEGSRL